MDVGALFGSLGRVAERVWRGAKTALREPLSHPVQALVTVVTLVGGIISIALGIRELADWIGGSAYESETSRLVIVDSSATMRRHFSPESKFDSATAQLLRYVRREPGVDVAVRFTSGRCDFEYTSPAVNFDLDNPEEIKAALTRQRHSLDGKADLAETFAIGR